MIINCIVSTPQHSPYKENPNSTWADQEWTWNKEKGCYETWFEQHGVIDTSNWVFTPINRYWYAPIIYYWMLQIGLGRYLKWNHQIYFHSEKEFLKAKVQ